MLFRSRRNAFSAQLGGNLCYPKALRDFFFGFVSDGVSIVLRPSTLPASRKILTAAEFGSFESGPLLGSLCAAVLCATVVVFDGVQPMACRHLARQSLQVLWSKCSQTSDSPPTSSNGSRQASSKNRSKSWAFSPKLVATRASRTAGGLIQATIW